jgi:antiphage defense system Thoeris ThsB-like protein
MASKLRIFISFAVEDQWARDYLVGQAKNEKSPFEFVNMSVYNPWDEKWKSQCRSRIKGCDGLIVLVSKNTAKGTGALWEVKTAKEELVPVIGIYTTTDERPGTLPSDLSGVRVVAWTWANITAFLGKL